MDFDPKYALERFRGMTREALLDEAALHTDEYVPAALQLLRAEALARGITDAQIEARRRGDAAPEPAPAEAIDYPALITSGMERQGIQALAETLRRDGVPAVVREVDTRRFHGSGVAVGRWGLFVAGANAVAAGRLLHEHLPDECAADAPGCGGCGGGSCATDDEDAPPPGDWDEDGDWWKTGAPGEDEQ